MSIFGDIGKALGGVVGNIALPGVGGLLGSAVGGAVGNGLGGIAEKALKEFTKNPFEALANPGGFAAKYADGVLKDMGLPAPFKNLAQFAKFPMDAIADLLKQGGKGSCECRGPDGAANSKGELKTNGQDVVDTGRYLISAKEDQVKIYDKETKTWVKCEGDPHLSTSDGDKGQFHKNLTIDLPDGTSVKIKTTPQQADGTSFIDKVAVLKGDEAVVMSGFHDGKAGIHMGEKFKNGAEVDKMWGDGTVLKAGREVDDLSFAKCGKEIRGGDPSARFGEWNLDNHGGKSQYGNDGAKLPFPFPFPKFPGNIGDIIGDLIGGKKPIPLPNLPGNIGDIIGDIIGGKKPSPTNPGAPGNTGTPGCDTTKPSNPGTGGASSGGSVYEKIFAILQKLQNQLNDKVGKLDGLDPKNDKAALDKGLFEVQQLQQQMTQLTQMATNLSSADHTAKKGIVDNLNVR